MYPLPSTLIWCRKKIKMLTYLVVSKSAHCKTNISTTPGPLQTHKPGADSKLTEYAN